MSNLPHDVLLIVMRNAGGKSQPHTLSKTFNHDLRMQRMEEDEFVEFVVRTFEGDLVKSMRAVIGMNTVKPAFKMYKLILGRASIVEIASLRRVARVTAMCAGNVPMIQLLELHLTVSSFRDSASAITYAMNHPRVFRLVLASAKYTSDAIKMAMNETDPSVTVKLLESHL